MAKSYNSDRELRKQEKLKYREYKLKQRSINSNYKKVVQSNIKVGFNIFALIILFLLIATLARRFTNGSIPSFTSLLAYLTTFESPTIPFNNQNGLVLGFLEFIFSNAIQGLSVFLDIIRFLFFG